MLCSLIQSQISFNFLFVSLVADKGLDLFFVICITAPVYLNGLSFGWAMLIRLLIYFYIRQALFFLFKVNSIVHYDFSTFKFLLIAFVLTLFHLKYLSLLPKDCFIRF